MTGVGLSSSVLDAMHEAGDDGLVGVVATTDERGQPHTAPFGSVRALSSTRLRFGCDRGHDTYANLCRRPHVVVCLLLPPEIAVSVAGRATVLRATMETLSSDAVIEVEIDDVKDDMLPGASIASGVTYAVPEEVAELIARYTAEVVAACG